MRTRGKAAALLVGVALMIAPAARAAQGVTVKGDPRAWAEIEAALTRFAAQPSYRAKGALGGGNSMTLEYVKPDRYHTTMTMGGLTESIQIGNEVRFRQGGGPWTCPPTAQSAPVPNMDPKNITGEVTAAKGPVATVDGVQTQTYTYTYSYKSPVPAQAGSMTIELTSKLFIAPNGLPKRIQTVDKSGAVDMTVDYFDYGAPITITLPACG